MKCSTCRHENPEPEFKACPACRHKHRIRNRRNYDANRDAINARKSDQVRERMHARISRGYVTLQMAARALDNAAVELAEMNGMVPTCNELAAYLDIPMGSAGLVRRRAFKLKPQKPGSRQPFIPYPVPKKYRAVGNEWETPSRRSK